MNKTITEGLILMPTPFSDGLNVWSKEDGTTGSLTYESDMDASFVPADSHFGGALELLKTETVQRLRYMRRTPIIPGCYLRVTARMRVMAGSIPSVRIAAWPGKGDDVHVSGLPESGPSVTPAGNGEVVEVTAIIGSGYRGGVDLSWGSEPTFAYVGIDLTGPSGGVVRIDDIEVEDVTNVFIAEMLPVVDVRDCGARGDGVTDDSAAFNAADAASDGREIIVPEGTFHLASDIYIDTHIRFEGQITQPANKSLVLRKNYDLPTYIDAFKDEQLAFEKALAALLSSADHDSLDMCGRRVELRRPIDVSQVTGQTTFEIRRSLRNGQLNVIAGPDWTTGVVQSSASYDPNNPKVMTGVTNVGQIEVGAHVTGPGIGREVYVTGRNLSAKTITLSQALWGGARSATYTFARYRYVLDFSGFAKFSKFNVTNVEFFLNDTASGVMLAPDGELFHLSGCVFQKLGQKGITSIGRGCQDLHIDQCQFVSSEQSVASIDRKSVGVNFNANDAKIRDSQFRRLGLSMMMMGTGHLIVGNHWFQGDGIPDTPRSAGLVLGEPHMRSVVTGNYIDNAVIEWTNEGEADPSLEAGYSFGGLTITGNIFTASHAISSFSWLVIRPHGPGHFLSGLSVQGNVFRSMSGTIERVEGVDDTISDLDHTRTRDVIWEGNTYNGVSQRTMNPLICEVSRASAQSTWTASTGASLPFGGRSRTVTAFVPNGVIRNGNGDPTYDMPSIQTEAGTKSNEVQIIWPGSRKGAARITVRCDR
ncbi:glycosyl hydrolase family 28-related protein [Palleronia caenipelagi]|uniref:Right-handed parallel beta-helix repeat-containing protein n=1 Tax=Palleronia caenipelagi TaxID=2489174 RepID=A0A547Q5T3_9RHOB|nr:glycosyl hydrolase family 28-related protein [Palleronia caenipelagi]TRD21728.1 right-handed parallel beta-helix repeat-containing protein [Palleronia caenipelagi]